MLYPNLTSGYKAIIVIVCMRIQQLGASHRYDYHQQTGEEIKILNCYTEKSVCVYPSKILLVGCCGVMAGKRNEIIIYY